MSSPTMPGRKEGSAPHVRTTRTEELRLAAKARAKATAGTSTGMRRMPIKPAADLFSETTLAASKDLFCTPERSTIAHKHFGSSDDVPITLSDAGHDGDATTSTTAAPESAGVSAFTEAFGDTLVDDIEEEEFELDLKLANLRLLGDSLNLPSSEKDEGSIEDVPLIREGRPLTSVSGLNLASVSQSLMAEGASDTGVEVNRLLSVGPNLRPALVPPPVNDADAADMGTKLLVVLDEGSPMIKYSGLDVSGNDVVVAIEENRELSVETNDCSSGKPPSAQDADKICPSVGGNGDYSVDDVVSPSNGAVDDLSDSAVLVMNAPTLDSSQRQNSGTLIGSGPPLATHKAAIRQVEVKAVSDLFGPSVPIDGFAARLAARAVPNQDAASLFGGLDAGSRDPFAAAAVEMKPLLKAQRRQQVDGDLFGAPYARLTEQLSIHPAVTEPPKPVPRNTSAELFGSTPPAAALADVFCSPASSVSDAGSLFGSGPPSHDVPQTEDKGSEHVYEITGMVVASVGSVTGSYPVNEHSKLAAVLSGSSAPVPTMNRATTVATTTSSPVSDSLPQPAAPVRASSGGARKTLLAVRTATDLFGPSADSFASTSVDALFGTAQSSIGNDLFGGVPVSSADAFSAPAPGVCNSLPVRGAAAGDVFSRAAPITAESSADPFSPPSAPGVKKGVTAAPYSSQGPRRSPCVGSQVGPAPVVISANGVPLPASVSLVEVAPVSSTQKGKPKVDGQRPRFPGSSGAATLPPGMIPTPHGFVPAVTLGGPIVVGSGGCTPPACASASGPAGGAASKGHLYRFPQPCAFISFGFGGKVIANTPPAQYPSGFGGQVSHQRTSPFSLKMYRLIDLIDAYCAVKKKGELWDGAEPELQRAEVKRLVELMKCFDGPLQFSQAESEIQSFIDGCLSSLSEEPLSTNMNDTNVHDKKGVESSERLLWGVLRILIDNNGMAQSESGCADPSSPESRLSALLLQSAPQRLFAAAGVPSEQTSGKEVFQPPTPGLSQSTLVEIENMLVAGNREEALHRALELNEFPLAILIGTVCGKDAFQHAVRSYADNRFSVESSLHFLSMIYSNQGAAALKVPVKLNTVSDIQSTAPLPIGNSHAVVKSWKDCSPHVKDWRRRLATILANKSGDWVDICRTLGERVYSETNDIAAAHVAYIVSGSLPSATAGKGKYSLLGCDGNSPYFRNVTDLHSILGLRRAEIIEWAVLRGTKRSQQLKSSSYESSGGLSLSNLFGLKANNPTRGTSSKLSGPTDTVSPERALRLRVAMCYPKLKFALWLADLGLTDSAAAYVVEAREIVRMCRITTPPTPKQVPRGKTEEPPSPMRGDSTPTFSKGFTRALDEFCDRLSGGGSLASSSIGKQALGGCDSAGGLWKGLGASISSALSSSNLKDFVDGPEPSSPPVVLDCGPRMQTHPPLQRSGPPMDTSREIIASMSQSQNSNLFSSNPIGGFPPSSRSTSHTTHEGGNMERTGSVPGDMLSYTAHADRRVVPLAPSSGSGSTGSEKKNPPRKDVEEDSGSGVVTKVRKGLLGWLYPDAKDTSNNMGTENKAYFDKDTGKWVFPGEEDVLADDPAAAPPPTVMMGPGPPAVVGNASTVWTASRTADDAPYDPLAAMMAPPSRLIPKTSSYGSMPTSGAPPSSGPPKIGQFSIPKASTSASLDVAAAPSQTLTSDSNGCTPPPSAGHQLFPSSLGSLSIGSPPPASAPWAGSPLP